MARELHEPSVDLGNRQEHSEKQVAYSSRSKSYQVVFFGGEKSFAAILDVINSDQAFHQFQWIVSDATGRAESWTSSNLAARGVIVIEQGYRHNSMFEDFFISEIQRIKDQPTARDKLFMQWYMLRENCTLPNVNFPDGRTVSPCPPFNSGYERARYAEVTIA